MLRYFAYVFFAIVIIGIFFRLKQIYEDIQFARENKRIMKRRKKLRQERASIELVNEMLNEIFIKENLKQKL